MNRFNLFFLFLTALVSGALHYSVEEEEKITQQLRSFLQLQQTAPSAHAAEKEEKVNKAEEILADCKTEE